MIAVLAISTVICLGLGLWMEVSEQRRLGRMACDCETRRGRQ